MTTFSRIATPGSLFANIPGILGFYPHDSVVFLAFLAGQPEGYVLGPTLRIDCALLHLDTAPELCESMMEHLDEINVDMVIALVLTRDAELRHITSQKLSDLRVNREVCRKIDACYAATEICTHEPYWLVWTASEAISPRQWGSGRIASVVAAPSMAPLLKEGILPEIDRDAAYHFFDYGNPFWEDHDLLLIHNEVFEFYHNEVKEWERYGDIHAITELKRKYRSEIREYLHSVTELSAEEVMVRREELITAATFMSSSISRDVFLNFAVESGPQVMKTMIAVARSFEGHIRANALCCYAVGALAAGLTMRIQPAIAAALAEVPEHNLARLILQAASYGQYQHILDAAGREN